MNSIFTLIVSLLFYCFFVGFLKVLSFSSMVSILISLEFCMSLIGFLLMVELNSLLTLSLFMVCSVIDGALGILIVWMIYRFSFSSTGLGVMKM